VQRAATGPGAQSRRSYADGNWTTFLVPERCASDHVVLGRREPACATPYGAELAPCLFERALGQAHGREAGLVLRKGDGSRLAVGVKGYPLLEDSVDDAVDASELVAGWRAAAQLLRQLGAGPVRPDRLGVGDLLEVTVGVADRVEAQRLRDFDGGREQLLHELGAHGVSPATVQRIWSARGLQPHRVDRFKLSNDPRFDEKLVDIVGLYLNPPEKAVVLCMDEETPTQ
jgi:hypothetical protein